jgi:hypothetical protein
MRHMESGLLVTVPLQSPGVAEWDNYLDPELLWEPLPQTAHRWVDDVPPIDLSPSTTCSVHLQGLSNQPG